MSDATVGPRRRWAPVTQSPSASVRYAEARDLSRRAVLNRWAAHLDAAYAVLRELRQGTDAERARACEFIAACDGLMLQHQLDLGDALLAEAEATAALDLARTAYLHEPSSDTLRRYVGRWGAVLLRGAAVCAAAREELRHG